MGTDHGGIGMHVHKIHFGANMARKGVALGRDVRQSCPQDQEQIRVPEHCQLFIRIAQTHVACVEPVIVGEKVLPPE